MTCVIKREKLGQTHTEGGEPCADRGRDLNSATTCQGMNTWDYWKLKRAKKDPPLEASEEAWPCQHLNCRLPASRTMK